MGKEDMSISQNVTSALSAIIPTFAGGTMDRADQVRVNPERLKEAMMRPNARLLKLDGLNPVFDAMGDLAWGGLYDASPDNDLLLLGIDDGDRPCFAELTGAGSAASTGDQRLWQSLSFLPPEQAGIYATARSLVDWHARHRFCSNCGQTTESRKGGWSRTCTREEGGCGAEHFPRTDPVAIMLAVRGDRGLLGRSGRFAATMWSCLAGFVEPGESIEDAVRRETLEEAGIRCGRVKYLYSQPWPFPMSLMNGCLAEALNDDIKMDANELVDCRWFTKDECAAMLMRKHPDGLTCPPPVAIAHHIIRTWVESDGALF